MKPFWDKSHHASCINNHTSDKVELGFNVYGPTLGLSGVLSATEKVIFIYEISIHLTDLSDGIEYVFEWADFRPHEFSKTDYSARFSKMASKFFITPQQPFVYNILFVNNEKYSEILPLLRQIKIEWTKLLEYQPSATVIEDYEAHYNKFLDTNFYSNALEIMKKNYFWRKGEYLLDIHIMTSDMKRTSTVSKSFDLSHEEAYKLQENIPKIIADICGQSKISYNFIFANLKQYKAT